MLLWGLLSIREWSAPQSESAALQRSIWNGHTFPSLSFCAVYKRRLNLDLT